MNCTLLLLIFIKLIHKVNMRDSYYEQLPKRSKSGKRWKLSFRKMFNSNGFLEKELELQSREEIRIQNFKIKWITRILKDFTNTQDQVALMKI